MSPNGGHLFCEKIKLKNNFVLQKTKKKGNGSSVLRQFNARDLPIDID